MINCFALFSHQYMRKNFYTYFLLMVLTIQILPVKQMGRALFGNQFTEELPHACDAEKNCCKKADIKSDFLYTPSFRLVSVFTRINFLHLYFSASIPSNHTGDIHVPPPNGC